MEAAQEAVTDSNLLLAPHPSLLPNGERGRIIRKTAMKKGV